MVRHDRNIRVECISGDYVAYDSEAALTARAEEVSTALVLLAFKIEGVVDPDPDAIKQAIDNVTGSDG